MIAPVDEIASELDSLGIVEADKIGTNALTVTWSHCMVELGTTLNNAEW